MKTSTLLLCAAMLALGVVQTKAQMSEYDYNQPVGWATVEYNSTGNYAEHNSFTVTGSNDANPVRVTTLSELRNAINTAKRTPTTIYIDGEINVSEQIPINNTSDLTIYGLPGSALINDEYSDNKEVTGILKLSGCNNVIIRNVTFIGSGAHDIDGRDNFWINSSSHNIWIDHCDFQDGVDSNFDCSNGSDNIAVTWCRFRYLKEPISGGSGGSDDHRFSNTWGGGDDNGEEDEGHLNTTFYACWWDEGCRNRMPRVRFGKVHLLNCLYTSSVTDNCVGVGYMSNVNIDRCTFIDIKEPWANYATEGNYRTYNVTVTGCLGANDEQSQAGSEEYFTPSTYYTLEGMPVNQVETEVSKYAGATLNVEYGEGVTTGISNIGVSDADVVSTEYFSPSGTKLSAPQHGLNIVRHKMSDGTVRTRKTIVK